MSLDNDPNRELALKLHLEMNGSGRRSTRERPIPIPLKRVKKEAPRPASAGRKETPSASGSGSGSGRAPRREGTFKRLVKKQPDSDSTQHVPPEEEQTLAAADSLEPQASAKAAAAGRPRPADGGDVGSRPLPKPDSLDPGALRAAAERAAQLARASALREASLGSPRVKCFYQGHAYGLSLHPGALASRESLAAALRAALAGDNVPVCRPSEMEILVLDREGRESTCRPLDADSCWRAAVAAAKRVYIKSASPMQHVS